MENTIIVTLRCKDMRSFGRQALAGMWSGAVLATLLMMDCFITIVYLNWYLIQSQWKGFRFIYYMVMTDNIWYIYYSVCVSKKSTPRLLKFLWL